MLPPPNLIPGYYIWGTIPGILTTLFSLKELERTIAALNQQLSAQNQQLFTMTTEVDFEPLEIWLIIAAVGAFESRRQQGQATGTPRGTQSPFFSGFKQDKSLEDTGPFKARGSKKRLLAPKPRTLIGHNLCQFAVALFIFYPQKSLEGEIQRKLLATDFDPNMRVSIVRE